ncbi:Pr6Pr family membrane protein [Nocardiopsis ansamitocini]|uniref:Integral membrane protein n=1 Tax=Nocardiopsis ansamitocini TaxID=1670832 RepID=A0A9W6UJZ0_9ACTN|nr:Pr6Pr family membrane protein [Nocardiopsis ansamitocini]GLU49369.1 hypothetical protein Nans01_37200 [Nocardiopsis ansamitocini]
MRVFAGGFRIAIVTAVVFGVGTEMWQRGLWPPLVFFTNQSNILLGMCMAASAWAVLAGRAGPPPFVRAGVTFFVLITGLVYNFILTDGPDLAAFSLADSSDLLHLVTPVMAAVDFLLLDERGGLRVRDAVLWLAYPLAYVVFTTVRGIVLPESDYPYFFVDVSLAGYSGVAGNAVLLALAFLVLGLCLVGADRLLGRMGAGTGPDSPTGRVPALSSDPSNQ